MNKRSKAALRSCLAPLRRRAASAYVAGPRIDDALLACHTLRARGRAGAVGFWNRGGDEPDHVMHTYLAAVDALSRSGLDAYLSIKAPALGYSPELIAKLLERARSAAVRVHFDSLSPESAERTLALIAGATQDGHQPGITLPARWRRSLGDADAAAELGVGVRVVKGQWPDPDPPEQDQRAGFMAVVEALAGRARWVAVATHDEALARQALGRLRAAGTPCELELLFGLPAAPAARAADELSAPVRVYLPYGNATVPYCLAEARKDARILGWLLQDLLRGRRKGRKELSDRLGPNRLPLGLANAESLGPPSGSRASA
ncbi:MAG: proline dehydrogenase [Actinomycetota bacterium]